MRYQNNMNSITKRMYGCEDWGPREHAKYEKIINTCKHFCSQAGFEQYMPGMFENAALLTSLGNDSDIVSKE